MAQSSGMVIAISFVFGFLPLVFLGLRIRARRMKRLSLQLDDWLVFASYFFFLLCIVVPGLILAFKFGLGNHTPRGPDGRMLPPTYSFNVVLLIAQVAHVLPLTLVKLSVLFFFRRIFKGRIFNVISWLMVVLTIIWCITFTVALTIQCQPVPLAMSSMPGDPRVECIQQDKLIFAVTITDVLMDVMIISIPFPIIWKLQMSTRDKVMVSITFLLGAITIGASVGRVVAFQIPLRKLTPADPDRLWFIAAAEWSLILECSLTIISACLPTLRPLVTSATVESMLRSVRSKLSLTSSTTSSQDRSWHAKDSEVNVSMSGDEKPHYEVAITSDGKADRRNPGSGMPQSRGTEIIMQREYTVTSSNNV